MKIQITTDKFHQDNHTTCADSFKSTEYTSLSDCNTEACEQTNRTLRRISSSSTKMNTALFLRSISLFLGYHNLKNNSILWTPSTLMYLIYVPTNLQFILHYSVDWIHNNDLLVRLRTSLGFPSEGVFKMSPKIPHWGCPLNVFVIVIVFVFVFVVVFLLVRSRFLIALIKCLKGQKSQRLLFEGVL